MAEAGVGYKASPVTDSEAHMKTEAGRADGWLSHGDSHRVTNPCKPQNFEGEKHS